MSTPDTVSAFRLVKKKWASSAFDGEGAKQFGGRFNSKGRGCVYLASSESLAILEIMVHLDNYRLLAHYALFRVDLPKSAIMQLNPDKLPPNWREDPAPARTASIGNEWLDGRFSLALSVPSAIVPREVNYLVNPDHQDFNAVVNQAQSLEFAIDARLIK